MMSDDIDTSTARHVTHGRDASIVACHFRGLSRESLACLAANLFVALSRTSAELERQLNDPEASRFFIADRARMALAAAQS